MVSADKLIKVGVKYSDSYFETLKQIYINAYRDSDSLEEFLNETSDYSIGNPLDAGGFKDQLSDLIVSSTNDIRFSRPAQKALMQTIIRNTTGELITNVGEDIKAGVRDIVSKGYRDGKLNHVRVANDISSELDGINHKRARTIARTEIKRAQTTSNYTVALERGANAYKYKCGAKPCDICKVDCGKTYPITDLEHLPPRHPNCMCGVSFFKDPGLPEVEKPTTTSEPTSTKPKTETNPNSTKIAELEKEIQELTGLRDKWKKRGNSSMTRRFEEDLQKAKKELDVLKNPKTKSTVKPTTTKHDEDVINNILADVLKDVGLDDIAPTRKAINPTVEVSKNLETTHESNLWENLAKKYDLELREASKTKVTFYDKKFDTPIRCDITKNGEWIDYTNQNLKKINIEEILKSYESASDIQKKATPIIKLEGKSLDQGTVFIGRDTFELNLYEGAFYKMEGSINGGNLKGAMHHEMWHCVDIRMTDEYAARNMSMLNSNMKGSPYKKAVTADRRSRKKTGGHPFVSVYARQSGGSNNVYEDFAEAGSLMSSNTFLISDAKGGYTELSKKEFMKMYPNRAKHFQDIMDNGELLW